MNVQINLIGQKDASRECKKIPLVVIHHNDELGYPVWSVVNPDKYDHWFDSFVLFCDAIDLAQSIGKNIMIDCSIRNCRVNHKNDHAQ